MKTEIEQLKKENAELQAKLRQYEESPFVNGYLAQLKQLNSWNKDLKEKPTSLTYNEDSGDADTKAFEKALKFMLESDKLYDKLDYFRGKMTPEQQESVKQDNKKSEKSQTKAI